MSEKHKEHKENSEHKKIHHKLAGHVSTVFGSSTVYAMVIIFLLAGLVFGFLISNYVLQPTAKVDLTGKVNTVALASQINDYLYTNLLPAETKTQGVTLEVTDMNEFGKGVFVANVYMVNGTEKNLAAMVYTDGKSLVFASAPPIDMTKPLPTPEAPVTTAPEKSDKPTVDLYVWAYCPYGVLAQGPLASVASLLKDKVDFKIVPYYDGHGAFETQENKIQLCIQKLNPIKYWDYAAGFVKDIYPLCSTQKTEACDKTESTKLMKTLGIDSAKVFSCVETEGATLFANAAAQAQANGVTRSPTVTVNGTVVNVARTAEAYKQAICDAFNTAPSECAGTLDNNTTAAAGSC
jgi:protein-disulfide isomerase